MKLLKILNNNLYFATIFKRRGVGMSGLAGVSLNYTPRKQPRGLTPPERGSLEPLPAYTSLPRASRKLRNDNSAETPRITPRNYVNSLTLRYNLHISGIRFADNREKNCKISNLFEITKR